MNRKSILILLLVIVITISSFPIVINANSYMSDKTEVSIDLEVSGAEALCQTDDGYIWIGQYSGLTRYDSKEFITYKNFEYEGEEYSILNVRALASKGNVVYVATSESVYVFNENHFEPLIIDTGAVNSLELDDENDVLYIATETNGGIIFDLKNKTSSFIPGTENKTIEDIVLDKNNDNYYYAGEIGVMDKNGKVITSYPKVFDICVYLDTLYIAEDTGIIHLYDMSSGRFLDDITIPDQINRLLYSPEENILFVACEKAGIYCIDFNSEKPEISQAGDLDNKSQLVDLMIDYEGNLWVASHYIGASGLSVITKNALSELLYDDQIWQTLAAPPAFDRNVYAVERYGDILYIVASTKIFLYDMNSNVILPDNVIMNKIDEYAAAKTAEGRAQGDENFAFVFSPKDVESFNDKIYFAVSNIGLVEYDPSTEDVNFYDQDYISGHTEKLVDNPDLKITNTMRCLRSFDDYLAIGYGRGIMRFDGEKFSIMHVGSNVLYINKTDDGTMIFDRTAGLYTVDEDFNSAIEIPTIKGITGNRLKFLVDGDDIYYTLNSRLFRTNLKNDNDIQEEVTIPYIKGSIVELAKVPVKDESGAVSYKYVIGSQSQVYITDSLEGDHLSNYEFYDQTNGLQPIIANTSGYYDETAQKYYFQSTNGIYVYDFDTERNVSIPVKMLVSSIDLDGEPYYGNNIKIDKNAYRVTFNLSILGFRPNKGYTVYYKLDGIDDDYVEYTGENRSIYYTNLAGGDYAFHVYVVDEYDQRSNQVDINLVKEKQIYEEIWFWIVLAAIAIILVVLVNLLIIRIKTKQSLKRQLEYKNITVESIQAIARTIDAKDEYTNGHSIRVGYYSKIIAENMGMKSDDVDNIYYIALLHDIGKIAIPDKVLNKPGKLSDEEFAVMKSHTTRGAQILKGISTIPHIIEGAKSHHEKYDGSGYPEGLKGEDIPFVARIICCADCFDAMASKRIYKEPFPLEKILGEFERCSGTQFDPVISKVVVELIQAKKLKPYTAENTYLGSDGKTHRIKSGEEPVV